MLMIHTDTDTSVELLADWLIQDLPIHRAGMQLGQPLPWKLSKDDITTASVLTP